MSEPPALVRHLLYCLPVVLPAASSVVSAAYAAGFMQWKQLLVLLLGCIAGPLETHTELFTAFLTAVTAQLQLGLAISGSSSSRDVASSGAEAVAAGEAGSSSSAAGYSLLGVGGLVDELLPDSFLRAAFRGFFEVLQESNEQAPAALLAQVGGLGAGGGPAQ